jgi:DNA-binding PadR family transcriptional regulator
MKRTAVGDPIDREIRLALWKIHILHHAAKGSVYGLWMLEELAEHGHRLSPGTLYPILARMEHNGWLRSQSAGRNARRTYRATAAGRRVLRQLQAEVTELYDEVVRDGEPARWPSLRGRAPGGPTGRSRR